MVRADASRVIGAGHAMRVSVIAEELIALGNEVIFVGDTREIPWVERRIENLDFTDVVHDPSFFQSNPRTDVLILDSYTISVEDVFLQKERWRRIVLIADQETPDYFCDLAINPGLNKSFSSQNSDKILFGPRYTPFRKYSPKAKDHYPNKHPLRILVVGGGTDVFNFSKTVSNQISIIKSEFICYLISEDKSLQNLDSRFQVIPPGELLDTIVDNSDLIITTASTSCLEFIAKSKPIGILCAVDNQNSYYEQLTFAGIGIPLGRYQNENWSIDFLRLSELVLSEETRENLISRGLHVFDLKGAGRIVLEILDIAK